jgi:serine protease Do
MSHFRTYKKSKVTLLLAVFIAMLVLVSGCTGSAVSTPSNTPTTTSTDTPGTSSAPTNFISAVQKVMPSVVKIEVTYGPQGAPGDPQATAASGTGWVVRSDGIIVTNNHVVDGAQTINTILPDGTQHAASNIKTNPGKDLAVFQIQVQNLPVATIGDSSQLMLGQPVAAIGNALNLGVRVTSGIVSQLNVTIDISNLTLSGLIETDATINPGNSGGVLIDLLGEVVGIPNAGLYDPNLDVENFGYAISINEAMPVINSLMAQIP